MSDLTDLVPPLELCKLIPEDEFTDAYAMWVKAWAEKDLEIDGEKVVTITMVIPKQKIIILPEPPTDEQREFCKTRFPDAILCKEMYFAPTLQEIMNELPAGVELSRDSEYFCSLDMLNEEYEESAVIAAMKVWLKLKGIEA